MNPIHQHLLVNHFPIIGSMIGVAILIYGAAAKKELLVKTAYVLLFVMALATIAAFQTGERAEHAAEEIGLSHDLIHEHEEAAELAVWFLYGAGLLALVGLWLERRLSPFVSVVRWVVVVLGIVGVALMGKVGNTGGEIRRPEIRTEATDSQNQDTKAEETEADDD